jgi:putative ABC transport system substrate-binding protein
MIAAMRRREFITLLGGAAAWPLEARTATAQVPDSMRRIAMLSGLAATDPEAQTRVAALRQGLKELGWVEGRNLHIDFRWGTGERDQMEVFAKELIGLKPELILGMTTPAVTALFRQTKTVPILFVNIVDPVGQGFISSLARPGGNITGFLNYEFSLVGKWLGTLKEIAPALRRVALLFNPDWAPYAKSFLEVAEAAAPSIGMEPITAAVHDDIELERTVADFAINPAGGLIVLPDVFTIGRRDLIITLAARYRLPAIYPLRRFTESGGLISYGADQDDNVRRSASYVDRILKGEKPPTCQCRLRPNTS